MSPNNTNMEKHQTFENLQKIMTMEQEFIHKITNQTNKVNKKDLKKWTDKKLLKVSFFIYLFCFKIENIVNHSLNIIYNENNPLKLEKMKERQKKKEQLQKLQIIIIKEMNIRKNIRKENK